MKIMPFHLLILFGITAGVFFLADLVWLGAAAKGLYERHFGHLLRTQVNWAAAALFYAIYIGGIQFFVLVPALQDGASIPATAAKGGLLGFFAYSTFELTGLALFKNWPAAIVVIDIAWGALLTGGTSAMALWLFRILRRNG